MAQGKGDDLKKFRENQPSMSSLKATKKYSTGGRFGNLTSKANAPKKFSPGRALENAASAFFDYIFPQESARKLARGEGLDEAGALALASLVPLPVGTALKGAGAVAKGAKGRLTQSVGEAVGEAGVKAANEAAGVRVPNKVTTPSTPKPAKKPGAMPKPDAYKNPSSFTRAMNNWQKRVGEWNKQNPKDKIKLPSDRPAGAPGKGKASRDTARQMREAQQNLTPSERQTVSQGKKSDKGIQEEVEALSPAPTTGFDPRLGGTGEAVKLPKEITPNRAKRFAKEQTEARSKSNSSKDVSKKASEKIRAESISATMAERLASPEARLALGAEESALLKPTTKEGRKLRAQSNANQRNRPQQFTSQSGKKTPLQQERSAANRARFSEAGATPDRRMELDPAINNPSGAELARQQQAEAVGYADRIQRQKKSAFRDLSGMEMPGQYGPDAVRINPRVEAAIPQPPRGMPREAADRVAARQRELFPDRTMTASGASQPKPPSPDPRMGLRDQGQRPVQRFTTQMTDEDYKAAGYVQVEQRIVDDAGNVSFRKVWMKPDMDVYVGGADTPPSLGPRSLTPKETGSTRATGYKDRNPNLGRFEQSSAPPVGGKPASAPEGPKPKGSKKTKTQPAATSASDDIEAIRASNYEQYRKLEEQGILEPGDADRIMGGTANINDVASRAKANRKAQEASSGQSKSTTGGKGNKKNQKGQKGLRGLRPGASGIPVTADAVARKTKFGFALGATGAPVTYSATQTFGSKDPAADSYFYTPTTSPRKTGDGVSNMASGPMAGQSQASLAVRRKQNEDAKPGEIRRGRGGKYMRRWNEKTGRWDIVGSTDKTAQKFLKERKKFTAQSIGAGGSVTNVS